MINLYHPDEFTEIVQNLMDDDLFVLDTNSDKSETILNDEYNKSDESSKSQKD